MCSSTMSYTIEDVDVDKVAKLTTRLCCDGEKNLVCGNEMGQLLHVNTGNAMDVVEDGITTMSISALGNQCVLGIGEYVSLREYPNASESVGDDTNMFGRRTLPINHTQFDNSGNNM